jgi:hypothetical protein
MTKKKPKELHKTPGAHTKYKKEFNEQVYKLCLLGADDKKIADFFDVSESTLNTWKITYPEFLESIKRGKENADAAIAESLYHRAKGYQGKETKFFQKEGKVIDTREVTVDHPPDTTACIFWLKNRHPEVWRDKQELHSTVNMPQFNVIEGLNGNKI